jgi:hypothetical protein
MRKKLEKIKKEKGWVKVPDAQMVDWDKQGQIPVEGRLISVSELKSKNPNKDGSDKFYKVFKVDTKTGQVAFTGSQLETKLTGVEIGTDIKVIFSGKVKTSNKFKVNTFDVFTR